MVQLVFSVYVFFFNDTATTEIYTLSLHDALPISGRSRCPHRATHDAPGLRRPRGRRTSWSGGTRRRCASTSRSEEHTSELQSRSDLVCRLLLEKKKKPTSANARELRLAGEVYGIL